MKTFCGYRTRLLPRSQAERFARCLAANPIFAHVTLKERSTARDRDCCHFVVYQPANAARVAHLRRRKPSGGASGRTSRRADYDFWADPDCPGLYWTLNLRSQEVYETTVASCDCGDYTFRGLREGSSVNTAACSGPGFPSCPRLPIPASR